MSSESSIPNAPPPWSCKCTAYVLPFFTSSSTPLLNEKILAPLEAGSEAWTSEKLTGKHAGGVGFAQILRYSETPVGSYDELVIIPGYFEAPEKVGCKGKHMRITGIWVSQEATCMNGRKNWNIPKHIAQFKFSSMTSSQLPLKIEVSASENTAPFFTATIHPTTYTPTFSFNSAWQGYLGLPTRCLQPPLPTGTPAHLEVGSEVWMRSTPVLRSKRCRVVWFDMQQSQNGEGTVSGTNESNARSKRKDADNWWPGIGRWRLGMSCEDATLELEGPEVFNA